MNLYEISHFRSVIKVSRLGAVINLLLTTFFIGLCVLFNILYFFLWIGEDLWGILKVAVIIFKDGASESFTLGFEPGFCCLVHPRIPYCRLGRPLPHPRINETLFGNFYDKFVTKWGKLLKISLHYLQQLQTDNLIHHNSSIFQ